MAGAAAAAASVAAPLPDMRATASVAAPMPDTHFVDNPFPQSWGPPTTYATRSDKLLCVLVGLPARGKSYVARRLSQYITFFYGVPCKVFNVGEYRRHQAGGTFQPAGFFDHTNKDGMAARAKASEDAVRDVCTWMGERGPKRRRLERDQDSCSKYMSGDFGALAVYDATNTTAARRKWLMDQFKPLGTKMIFIEVVCRDEEMITHNIMESKIGMKDYKFMSADEAVADFRERIALYEQVYETMGQSGESELSWIKIVDGGREFSMHNIRGFLPSRITQFLLNLHIQRRPFYFSRHGQSEYNRLGKIGGDSGLTKHGEEYATALADWVHANIQTGSDGLPQPARLWTSSLQRTIETARHIRHDKIMLPNGTEWVQMRHKFFRNLDELYAGLCDGMTYEEIAQKFPAEAAARQADKFEYRYPRGESYTDLIARLEPMVHELERQQEPLLVVAHQAILRVLYAYFMELPREACPDVSIPLNTVIKITPTATGCEEDRIAVLPERPDVQLDPASH